jgi:hypothetical protein
MNPTKIKDELVIKLKTLTIDDIFADPKRMVLNTVFHELTDTNAAEEVESYLLNHIKNLNRDIYAHYSIYAEQQITVHQRKSENTIRTLSSKVEKIKQEISETENSIKQQNEKKNTVTYEINTIDNDISLLNKTPEISIYREQIRAFENKKQYTTRNLDEINKNISQFNSKADSLKIELEENIEQINTIHKIEKDLEEKIKVYKSKIIELEQLDNTTVINELKAIDYISILLLDKSYRRLQQSLVKTGSEWLSDDNAINFRGAEFEYSKHVEDIGLDYRLENIKYQNCEPPSKWRKILYESFSKKALTYAGILFKDDISDDLYGYSELRERIGFNSEILKNHLSNYTDPVPFDTMELSYIIALKQSLRFRNPCIRTSDNGILLHLSGGVSAEIYFREKGKTISEFAKENGLIYRNMLLSDKYKAALEIHCDFAIDAPCGFYVLAEHHVIEIYFRETPVLMDSPNLGRFMQLALIDEANKKEEPTNRINYNDDYCDDYWDYDD